MIENKFKYCTDFHYEGFHDCESYGCNDEGVCRCYKITHAWIESVNINSMTEQIIGSIYDTKSVEYKRDLKLNGILSNVPDDINSYFVNRILTINKVFLPSNWEVTYGPSYYGEEVDDVILNADLFNKIVSDINLLLSLTFLSDKVELILNMEYGYLLPSLIGREYFVQNIYKNQISFGQKEHLNKIQMKSIHYYSDSDYKAKIRGVVIADGNQFKLIDGYHRMAATKKEIVPVIVAI